MPILDSSTISHTNNTQYAFSDSDIRILLKGLAVRDVQHLVDNKECLDPITLDDNSIQLILTQERCSRFEGEGALEEVSLLCPIKVRGEFHWNLLEIKKDEYGIHVSLYDTDGSTKLLDESLKCQLTQSFTSELTFEYTTTKKWFNPGQKGVNCGLIVALMAHQLRLRSGSLLGSDFNTYAGIDTQTLSDQGIRNEVSDVVTEYCEQVDRQLFCKTRPTRHWVRQLRGITYNANDKRQKQLYDACCLLDPEQIKSIKAEFDTFNETDMTVDDMSSLKDNLRSLSYASFLFTIDKEGTQVLDGESENIIRYKYAIDEALESSENPNLDSKQEETYSTIDQAINTFVSESVGLNQVGLEFLHEQMKKILKDCGENQESINKLHTIFTILQEGITCIRSIDENPPSSSDEISTLGTQTDPQNALSQSKVYCADEGVAYALTQVISKASIGGMYDVLSQEDQKNILGCLEEAQHHTKKTCISSFIRDMLTENSGNTYLSNHQADAVIMAIIANLNGKGFLLADQPGVGKTRTMVATAILHRKLERLDDDGNNKKTLIIVSNDNENTIFKKELETYTSFVRGVSSSHTDRLKKKQKLSISSGLDGLIEIKTVSKAIEIGDYSDYDQIIVDEIHSKVDKKSVIAHKHAKKSSVNGDKEESGILEKLKKISKGKDILLASATAAKSLDELSALIPMLNMDSQAHEAIKCSWVTKRIHERLVTDYLISDLHQEGLMASRMLADSQKLQVDIDAQAIYSNHIEVESLDDSIVEQHKQYNHIIGKINEIRDAISSEHDSYNELNAMLLLYIERLRDSIVLSKKLVDVKKVQMQNPGHHIILCIHEFGDQKKRVENIITTMEAACKGDAHIIALITELDQLNKEFPLVTKDSLESDNIKFNPDEICVKDEDHKNRIYVCSRSHLQGVNLNGLLTKKTSTYRDNISRSGGKFEFHLDIIGALDGWDRVWQAMHRVIRFDNVVPYKDGLEIAQSYFIGDHSRIHAKRFRQKHVLRAFRSGKSEENITDVLIEHIKNELGENARYAQDTRYKRLKDSKTASEFWVEMDFLDIEGLLIISKMMQAKEQEEKSKNHTKVNLAELALIHTGKHRGSKIYQYNDFLICTQSAYVEYEKYLSSIFRANICQFDVEGSIGRCFGIEFAQNNEQQRYLTTKQAFTVIDDLTHEESLELIKMALSSEKVGSKSKRKKAQKSKQVKAKRIRNGSSKGSKRKRVGKLPVLQIDAQNYTPGSDEPDEKKVKLTEIEEGVRNGAKKLKTQDSSKKPDNSVEICRQFLELFHVDNVTKERLEQHLALVGETSLLDRVKGGGFDHYYDFHSLCLDLSQMTLAQDCESTFNDKKSGFKKYLAKQLQLGGYIYLLDTVKDPTYDYHYSFYHLCLAFGQWDLVELCETEQWHKVEMSKTKRLSALGVLSEGTYGEDEYHGWSLLHRAVFERNIQAVRYLCREDNPLASALLNCKTLDQDDQCSALHMAMENFNTSFGAVDNIEMMSADEKANCTTDLEIIGLLVSSSANWQPARDSKGNLPLALVKNTSALNWLLENIDETARCRLEEQKKTSCEYITEESEELDLSNDDSDHPSGDPNSEVTETQQLEANLRKMRAIVDRKLQEREKKERDLRDFISGLNLQKTFNFIDFKSLCEACRLSLESETSRSQIISILGIFVKAIQAQNKMRILYHQTVKLSQDNEGKSEQITVRLTLPQTSHIVNSIRKMMQQGIIAKEEKKRLIDCCIIAQEDHIKHCHHLLLADNVEMLDVVLAQVDKWALEIGYKKISATSMSDSSEHSFDDMLNCCYQKDDSGSYDLIHLLALHGKGNLIQVLRILEPKLTKKSSIFDALLGTYTQSQIDRELARCLIDMMLEEGAYDKENIEGKSPLKVLLERENDSDFIYFLELTLDRFMHAVSAGNPIKIDWSFDSTLSMIERRISNISSEYTKNSSLSDEMSETLDRCARLFTSINESLTDKSRTLRSRTRNTNTQTFSRDNLEVFQLSNSEVPMDYPQEMETLTKLQKIEYEYKQARDRQNLEDARKYISLFQKEVNKKMLEQKGWSDLMKAAAKNNMGELDSLINAGNSLDETDEDNWHALHIAVRAGHLSMAKKILEVEPRCIDVEDNYATTPLMLAIQNGDLSLVKFLIDKGADFKTKDCDGEAILYRACMDGYLRIVKFLLEKDRTLLNKRVLTEGNGRYGNTVLHGACFGGKMNVVKYLISLDKDLLHQKGDGGISVLHSACGTGKIKIAKYLISLYENLLHEKTSNTSTVLHAATSSGVSEMVEYLIIKGCDINDSNAQGNTPLHLACYGGYFDIVKLLVEKGAHLDTINFYAKTPKAMAEDNLHNRIFSYLEDQERCQSSIVYQEPHRPLPSPEYYNLIEAVKKNGHALRYASAELRGDREIVLEAVKSQGYALQYASAELKGDRGVVLEAVKQNGYALKHTSSKLKGDRGVVLEAVKDWGLALEYASAELRGDREVVIAAVMQNKKTLRFAQRKVVIQIVEKNGLELQFASAKLKKDREIVLAAVKQNGEALEYASPELRGDRGVVLEAVKQDGEALKYASSDLKGDHEVVTAAVMQTKKALMFAQRKVVIQIVEKNGLELQFVSAKLKKDREFVLEAVKQSGYALKFALAELRGDREVVLEAVKSEGFALKYASAELRGDREFVLEAVKQNGGALDSASAELRGDREVVLEAVKSQGWALQYASAELQGDREIVLEVVKSQGWALRYASEKLRGDREIVLEAVKSQGFALKSASAELRGDREFVLEAVKQNGGALDSASAELRGDREVVLEAVKQDGEALEYASAELRGDREIVLEAVKQYGLALRYSSYVLRGDREVVIAAVMQTKKALRFAQRKIVIQIVEKNGLELQFASAKLKKDREIVLAAVKQNGEALQYASVELRGDREIVLEAVKQNGLALKFALAELREDAEILQVVEAECIRTGFSLFRDSREDDHMESRAKAPRVD